LYERKALVEVLIGHASIVSGVRLESFVGSSHTEPLTMTAGRLKLKLSGLSSSREIIRAAGMIAALISGCSDDDSFLHSALFRLPDPVTM
jgi:hypothetical protein